MNRIALILLALLMLQPASASSIKGAGATTCGSWLQARQRNDYFPQLHWMQGFISSYNQYVDAGKDPNGIFGSTDASALAAWMDNYCHARPLESVYAGTVQLVEELKQRAAK